MQNALNLENNLSLSAIELQQQMAKRESVLAKNQLLPGISASYFQRSNSSIDQNFDGYQVGLNIPLLFFGERSKIKSAKIAMEAQEAAYDDAKIALEQEQNQLLNKLNTNAKALDYVETKTTQHR